MAVHFLYSTEVTNQKPRNLLHRQAGRQSAYSLYSEVALAKKRSKELLKIKNLELSDMHKFEAIKDENDLLKNEIKHLKAAKVDLVQRIGFKSLY